jgi:hypothetical protein
MTRTDLTALLELKRVRERRAAAALAGCRRKERVAAMAEIQAKAEASSFAAQRTEREAAIHDRLARGPRPARDVLLAGAALAELSSCARQLHDEISLATQEHAASMQARTEAERRHARSVRDTETFQLLQQALGKAAAAEEQQAQQDELDEIAIRRRGHGEPVW